VQGVDAKPAGTPALFSNDLIVDCSHRLGIENQSFKTIIVKYRPIHDHPLEPYESLGR
jgi:hypothetical protein